MNCFDNLGFHYTGPYFILPNIVHLFYSNIIFCCLIISFIRLILDLNTTIDYISFRVYHSIDATIEIEDITLMGVLFTDQRDVDLIANTVVMQLVRHHQLLHVVLYDLPATRWKWLSHRDISQSTVNRPLSLYIAFTLET